MDTKFYMIRLILGIFPAVGIGLLWYKFLSYKVYHLTDELWLSVAGHGFLIKDNWAWQNKKVQFSPLRFFVFGGKIGRKRSSTFKASVGLDGCTEEVYRRISRTAAELKYDFIREKFYLESQETKPAFRWNLLGDCESEPLISEKKRLYLDINRRVWFDCLSLDFELVQKKEYNPEVSFNSGLCIAFVVYQAFGLCLLLHSPIVSRSSVSTICLPVFLLLAAVWALLHNCDEVHPIQTSILAFFTIGYFAYVIYAGNSDAAVEAADFFVRFCALPLLLAPEWNQIESKGTFVLGILIAEVISASIAENSISEIGNTIQTIAYFLILFTQRTANQKIASSAR